MQKVCKSVTIWQSYREFKGGNFFETQCSLVLHYQSTQGADHAGWLEFAGLEKDGPENDGLENDGVEQEQTYILHTMKNFNVYDM